MIVLSAGPKGQARRPIDGARAPEVQTLDGRVRVWSRGSVAAPPIPDQVIQQGTDRLPAARLGQLSEATQHCAERFGIGPGEPGVFQGEVERSTAA
jgi:hypothetical protein